MKTPARLHFAHLPTPIEELPRLSAELGGPRLLVKRDDQTGLAFGGNKTRKLEFLVAEAQQQGCKMLISAGAAQSNHCRQTAAAAARFGMECMLVLNGEHPKLPTGNLMLDHLFNADVVWVKDRKDRDAVLAHTYQTAQQAGAQPYLVPYGGSSPTGAYGYTFAMEEVMKQMSTPPSHIVFGTSSGGTHAGLTLGSRLFGYKGQVLGISIDESVDDLKRNVSALATQSAASLGSPETFGGDDIFANDDYCQAGYGVFGEGEREAISLFAGLEGLLLDPVYTGRAAAGLIDLIRKGAFRKEDTVLFWHTGGQVALFADKYQAEIL